MTQSLQRTQKIKKILIANRAEIAVRIINTCRTMGIASVAVYAEDDGDCLHRQLADEAYCLGKGALSETYLNQQKLIELAQRSGAQAVHPGYGFLSERAEFAQLCEREGLIFIGPTPEIIRLMGDKAESKKALEGMGIPLIPGFHGCHRDGPEQLRAKAQELGTPLLIKAVAGGGGMGMRLVEDLADFEQLLALAQGEAQNAFGNSGVLLEKFIPRAHHVEVQVLSSAHGQHFHFGERECSIQRRHQKVIEETPSPALASDQGLRQKICGAAVELCRQIDYLGAGTVEFILDGDDGGVLLFGDEHPPASGASITEMVTGYDLVGGPNSGGPRRKTSHHPRADHLHWPRPGGAHLRRGPGSGLSAHHRDLGTHWPQPPTRHSTGVWVPAGKRHRHPIRSHDRQTLRPLPLPAECY